MGQNTPTKELFDSTFIANYNAGDHRLKQLFDENDVVKWNSKSKINFYHCSNDDVIPSIMSNGAVATLKAYGSNDVNITIIEGIDANYSKGESIHGNCGATAYGAAITWFDKIRFGEIK
jgi:hypothetical protein